MSINTPVMTSTQAIAPIAPLPVFYSDTQLAAKTQKQLTAILNDELQHAIAPNEAKKLKNAGLIALIIDLQSKLAASTQAIAVETVAVETIEPVATVETAITDSAIATAATEEEDPDRITDHDLDGLNEALKGKNSPLSFKRYNDGIKIFSNKVNASIKAIASLSDAWDLVESQPTVIVRDGVTQYINPIVETADLVGRDMVKGLTAIASKADSKGTKKNNSSGKDAIFDPKVDEIKPVKAGSLNHQYFVDLLEGCTLDQLIDKYPSIANYTVNGKPDPKWCARDKAAYSTLLYGYRVQRVNGVYKIINATEILVATPKVKEVKEPKVKVAKVKAIAPVEPVAAVTPRATTQRKAINITASTAKRNKRSRV